MSKNFKRQDNTRHHRLGGRRVVPWRKPKGRHSKMRQKRAGYPQEVTIGCRTSSADFGKISGLVPVWVNNLKALDSIDKKVNAVILARVGAKKKLELVKKAEALGLKILNSNRKARK